MKQSLGQNTFFIYFRYFWKVGYNFRGTFVLVPISTHPIIQYVNEKTADKKETMKLQGYWVFISRHLSDLLNIHYAKKTPKKK
jgi:hypothetical protein